MRTQEMAVREELSRAARQPAPVGPSATFIFGASGNLAARKLVPALHDLARARLLPDALAIVGVATSQLSAGAFHERLDREVREHVGGALDPTVWGWLLALIAMEPPISFAADAVRHEKAKVLHAIKPTRSEGVLTCTARGQYGGGVATDGRIPAYRVEPRVAPESTTETYAAVRLLIDSWRWAGVPFYLRSGKQRASRQSEIAIEFKSAPSVLFRNTPMSRFEPNLMVIRIQPEEGISVRFGAKFPGPSLQGGNVDMDFCHEDYFGATPSTGYETLLYDCASGDATPFQRANSVEAGWRVVMPTLDVWSPIPPRSFPNYPAGTSGPAEADQLLARDGRKWRPLW